MARSPELPHSSTEGPYPSGAYFPFGAPACLGSWGWLRGARPWLASALRLRGAGRRAPWEQGGVARSRATAPDWPGGLGQRGSMAALSWQKPSAEPVQEMTQTSTHARRDGNGTLGPPQAALAPHCHQNLCFSTHTHPHPQYRVPHWKCLREGRACVLDSPRPGWSHYSPVQTREQMWWWSSAHREMQARRLRAALCAGQPGVGQPLGPFLTLRVCDSSCSPPLVELILRHSACSFHGNWGGSLHPRASYSSTATQTEGRRRSIFELGQVSLSTGPHRPSPGWLARPHCPSLSTSWEWGRASGC